MYGGSDTVASSDENGIADKELIPHTSTDSSDENESVSNLSIQLIHFLANQSVAHKFPFCSVCGPTCIVNSTVDRFSFFCDELVDLTVRGTNRYAETYIDNLVVLKARTRRNNWTQVAKEMVFLFHLFVMLVGTPR